LSVEDAIVERIQAVDVGGIGAGAAARLFPQRLRQGEPLPAIVYQNVGNIEVGAFVQQADVRGARIQITCWGSTYDQAKSVWQALMTQLSRARGTFAGVVVQDILPLDESGGDTFDDVTETHGVRQDFIVWYQA
jgi:hypothetical protein